MITFDDFEQVKRRVADLRRKRDEEAGQLKQLLAQLKQSYGCESLTEAQRLITKRSKQETTLAHRWMVKLRAFKKRWAKQLKEMK